MLFKMLIEGVAYVIERIKPSHAHALRLAEPKVDALDPPLWSTDPNDLSLSLSLSLSIARAPGRSDTHAKKKDAQGCAQVAVVRAEAGERASVGMASCDTHKHTHTKHTQKNTHKQTHTHTHTRRTDLVARRECAWPGRRCHQQHSQGESLS